eukprot:6181973-Pleurochrysis_carterae.AAC.1
MAVEGILRSFQVLWWAEHHTFGHIGAHVIFAWSLVGVQPVSRVLLEETHPACGKWRVPPRLRQWWRVMRLFESARAALQRADVEASAAVAAAAASQSAMDARVESEQTAHAA